MFWEYLNRLEMMMTIPVALVSVARSLSGLYQKRRDR